MTNAYTIEIVREQFSATLSITQEMVDKKTVLKPGDEYQRVTHSMRLPRINNARCSIPKIDSKRWSELLAHG